MSNFDAALANLNQACMGAFAEDVTFVLPGGNVVLQGVFDSERSEGSRGNIYALSVLESEVMAHGIELRGKVVIRGIDYQILDRVDNGGIVEFTLKRY
ncbi:MAG: head-tail joining protein [Gammaproteobacteria bacterium]